MRKLYSFFCVIILFFSINSNAQVVISQVYGGGGNSGATLRNDFIELFNRGTTTINLTGWSVQYASSSGTTWQRTNISGSIAPGQYYLIQEAQGSGGTVSLPTPDATGTIAMSASSGKVALVSNQTTLTGSCPTVGVVDFVGFGTANCSESSPTPILSNTTAALRAQNGCTDDNNNSTDFSTGTPNPRNTASPLNQCTPSLNISINDVSINEGNTGTSTLTFTVSLTSPAPAGGVTFDIATQDNTATIPDDYVQNILTGQSITAGNTSYQFSVTINGDATVEPNETFYVNITNVTGANVTDAQGVGTILNDDFILLPISQIQGSGNISAWVGNVVSTSGIVTGIKSNGFFLQTSDASTDNDPATSEGIFIFTSIAPPASVAVGNSIIVTGTVAEFPVPATPGHQSQTEITGPSILLLSTGNTLPTPVTLSSTDTDPGGSLFQLEKYEGMRVTVPSLTVVAPTEGSVSETNATSTSNGFFYGVITGLNRPFREPGVQLPDQLPAGAPPTVTRFDANPELIPVASRSLIGATAIDVATGAVITNLTGPLDISGGRYTIDADPVIPSLVITNNNLAYTAIPAQLPEELTVASFNMERFFDNVNDPAIGDPVLTATAYNNRLNKASLAIRNVLRTPDVIGAIEIENLTVLKQLATRVNNDAIADGQPNPEYTAYLVEGNDVGGIDVGFLVRSGRVNVNSVTQYGKNETYVNPSGVTELLNDRPPLVLNASFNKPGCNTPYDFIVIVNHLRSLNGVDDPVDGNRVRSKRKAQAESLASLIQSFQAGDPSAKIISVGDYNAFEFSDGFVDVIGTIKGSPAAASEVVLATNDLVDPDLTDLLDLEIQDNRYSYVFEGSAQVLDHIIVNQNALNTKSRFSIARLNADFPEAFRNDANRPERLSDHDAPVAYFLFTDITPPVAICKSASITLVNGIATLSPGDINNGSNDECGNVALSVSKSQFTCSDIGENTVTLTVTDDAGNTSTCNATVTVIGEIPSCSITAVPENNIYTGGVPTNIYLGYGPQKVTLNVTANGGAPYTYSWSGSNLSCTTCEDPEFTPVSSGTYNFLVTVTNTYGCTTTCSITINVVDIRVPGTNGKKVYLCHSSSENQVNSNTIAISVNSVNAHLMNHPGDKLGECNLGVITLANRTSLAVPESIAVTVLPNPSRNSFTIKLESHNELPVQIRILDLNGKEVSRMNNVANNNIIRIGEELKTGVYFAEIIQGAERKILKLIKIQ